MMLRSVLMVMACMIPFSIGAAKIITVPGNYSTINDAIKASASGDEILVHPGTYMRISTSWARRSSSKALEDRSHRYRRK